MPVIEIAGLRKEYRRPRGRTTVAVDGLDLSVAEGGVFGFLGPNGSGKTTTIRCLLGLVRPSAGSCRLLGAEVATSLFPVIGRVGAIVETPAFFPSSSGRHNLALLGRLQGIGPLAVDAVLDRVGLTGRADDAVKGYSLGMRQRLGLAAVLLKDPEVLILDEPANGLDPAGIREIRVLLRQLGAEGRTVFVSSHQLGEIQQTCDRVAILREGRCVLSGAVDEVLTGGRAASFLVRVGDRAAALGALQDAGIRAAPAAEGLLLVDEASVDPARVTETLARRRLWVTELRPQERSLEDVFLELTETA
ncbi:MAG: ATP-binding cassette domain-containing protein [Acidimicrobiia bacterium]|nr:ATP-binding cassette domain-containing protein [Acidimicrobiia bacterium]